VRLSGKMRNILIEKIYILAEIVDGFEYLFEKMKDMSNDKLLELYVEMRIEEYEENKE
jgi:hypothetical protein